MVIVKQVNDERKGMKDFLEIAFAFAAVMVVILVVMAILVGVPAAVLVWIIETIQN